MPIVLSCVPPLPQAQSCIQSGSSRPDDLLKLLCALQASLFVWCRRHITSEEGGEKVKGTAASLLRECEHTMITVQQRPIS